MLRIKSELLRRSQRRRLRFQTNVGRKRHIVELFLMLLFLIALNTIALMFFEDLSLADAIWFTMTTVSTVGYGDFVATTPGGRIAIVVLLYIFGIFLLAQIAGEWIDYRFDRRDRMRRGLWRWKMKDHILILNTPCGEDRGLEGAVAVSQQHAQVAAGIASDEVRNGVAVDVSDA